MRRVHCAHPDTATFAAADVHAETLADLGAGNGVGLGVGTSVGLDIGTLGAARAAA